MASLSLSWGRPPVIKGLKVIDRGQEPAAEGGGSERKRGAEVVSSSSSPFSSSSASSSSSSPPPALLPPETSGSVVAAADAVSASRSLAAIVFTKKNFEVVVTRPFVDLFPTSDGRTSRVVRALQGGGGDGDGGTDSDGDDENGFELGAASYSPSSEPEQQQQQQQQQQLPYLGQAAGLRFSAEARGGLGGGARGRKGGRGRGRSSGTSFSLVVADGRARVPLDLREALGESVHAVALLGEEALLAEGAEMLTYRGRSRGGEEEGGEIDDDEDDDGGGNDAILTGISPSSPLSVPYDASWASRWRNSSSSRRRRGSRSSGAEEREGGAAPLPLLFSSRGGRAAVPAAFEVRSEKAAVAADGWLLLPSSSASLRGSSSGSGSGARGKKPRGSTPETTAKTPVFVLRKPAAARAALTPPLVKHCLSRLSPLLADAVAVGGGGGSGSSSGSTGGTGGPALAATLSPAGAVLFPRLSRGVVRVEPLLVELRRSDRSVTGIASKALGWLDAAAAAASVVSAASGGGGGGGSGGGGRRRFPFGGGGSRTSSPLAAALTASPSLVAWTSPAELDLRISRRGGVAVGVRRIDVLVGPPERKKREEGDAVAPSRSPAAVIVPDRSRSARFATWGTVDAEGGRLALTLGIPAETLKRAAGGGGGGGGGGGSGGAGSPPSSPPSLPPAPPPGKLAHVPDDAMLCVDIRGSLDSPRVDFAGATQRLAELFALSSASEAGAASPPPRSSGSRPLVAEGDRSPSAPASFSPSSFVSPALVAVRKIFWRKAAERARGGGAAEPRSAPGSGGGSVPRSPCEAFPWEGAAEGAEGGGAKGAKRRLGQIEAVLSRQERQRRQRRREAVLDER